MLIAIDFDGTISLDIAYWQAFIHSANENGSKVILTTSRTTLTGLPYIYGLFDRLACGPTHKRAYCTLWGYYPDIWIDDQPETVNGPGWLWCQRLKGAFKSILHKLFQTEESK